MVFTRVLRYEGQEVADSEVSHLSLSLIDPRDIVNKKKKTELGEIALSWMIKLKAVHTIDRLH